MSVALLYDCDDHDHEHDRVHRITTRGVRKKGGPASWVLSPSQNRMTPRRSRTVERERIGLPVVVGALLLVPNWLGTGSQPTLSPAHPIYKFQDDTNIPTSPATASCTPPLPPLPLQNVHVLGDSSQSIAHCHHTHAILTLRRCYYVAIVTGHGEEE